MFGEEVQLDVSENGGTPAFCGLEKRLEKRPRAVRFKSPELSRTNSIIQHALPVTAYTS